MENWHLDHDDVLAINPNIVYLRMPGMGLAGPWRDRVGVRADDGADERAGVDHRLPRRHPAHPPRPRRSHRRAARRVRDPHRAHAAGPHRQGRRDRGADDRGGDQRHRGTGPRVRRHRPHDDADGQPIAARRAAGPLPVPRFRTVAGDQRDHRRAVGRPAARAREPGVGPRPVTGDACGSGRRARPPRQGARRVGGDASTSTTRWRRSSTRACPPPADAIRAC